MEIEERSVDIEKQYQAFLKLVNLSEDKMGEQQRIQTKQAFYGGVGRILWLLRDVIGKCSKNDQRRMTTKLWDQSKMYWNQRSQKPEGN